MQVSLNWLPAARLPQRPRIFHLQWNVGFLGRGNDIPDILANCDSAVFWLRMA
jgi:hypothetical protein